MYVLIRKRIIIINSTREILQVYKLDKQWKISNFLSAIQSCVALVCRPHFTTSTAIQKSGSLGCDLYIFKRKDSSMLAT